jgi:hypothetical protein
MVMAINLIIQIEIICYFLEQFELVSVGRRREWMRTQSTFYGEAHEASIDMGED